MKVVILGSGTSTGVPVIGCHCPVCKSSNPRNHRTRASIAVQEGEHTILIDTSPEMRLQVLAAGIESLDAVLYTHIHADHSQGFDDLRAFHFKSRQVLDCYLMAEYHEEFKERFRYAFVDTGYRGSKPQVCLKAMPDGPFNVGKFSIEPIRLDHGSVRTCGFRFGSFVYITDFKKFPDETLKLWRGQIDTIVA
ncbi:MAG: MBL fold metallo-hydrolase, partial [Proteobacteria bacterium]|nr:MBL fold metallo-hydrolase [Pseudomonadota bacterium]